MSFKALAWAVSASLAALAPVSLAASGQQQQVQQMTIKYPTTHQVDVVDDYFGTQIKDPYRWLEDDRSEETAHWVAAQNKVTFGYLEQIPYRQKIEQRLTELLDYEKVSSPFKEGKYTYFYKNDGLQNQDVLYRQQGDGEAEVFLDPNTFSEEGTTSLGSVSFSKDGSLVAYSISEGGSDWRKVIVLDAESKKPIGDTLEDVKFSGISWRANEGFYYSSYDKPEGSELSAKTDQHKLYFHQLGTPQADDELIFGGSEAEKHRYVSGYVTEDGRYLAIGAMESTSGNKLYVQDLTKPEAKLVTVQDHTGADTWVIASQGDTLYLETNLEAPNTRVVKVNIAAPQASNWVDVIAETQHVLSTATAGGSLFAQYMVDATSQVKQFDMNGKLLRTIELPDIGSTSGFSGKQDESELYYTFTNYKTPGTIYKLNINSGKSQVYRVSEAPFDSDKFESEQVFYTSKDGH